MQNGLILMGLAALTIVSSDFAGAYTSVPEYSRLDVGTPGEQVLRPDLERVDFHDFQQLGSIVEVQRDSRGGAIRVIEAAKFADVERIPAGSNRITYEDACLKYIAAQSAHFGIDVESLRIHDAATLVDAEDQFFKFFVKREGLLVADAEVNCRFKEGRLVQITNFSYAEALPDLRPVLVSSQGLRVRLRDYAIRRELDEQYRVVVNKSGYQLVRVKRFDVMKGQGRFIASVDYASGEIFEMKSQIYFADIPGRAVTSYYERNYNDIVSAGVLKHAKVKSGAQTYTTDTEGGFSAPDSTPPKLNGFDGTFIKVAVKSGTLVTTEAARNGSDWFLDYVPDQSVAKEGDKNMAQSMMFFHVNRIIELAKNYIQPTWFNRALGANANLTQTCNAHWDGTTINFYISGSGCANTALISDVIYHEWGHGLDANTGGISDGAFSEGFGDIMALLFTRSPIMAPGFKLDGSGIRNLAPNKVYPKDRGGVHAEGLIIGGTFYDMYEMLSADKGSRIAIELLAKYAFKGIYAATKYTDMYDALKIIDDDDGNPVTMSPNFCVLNKAFRDHGLATADSRCP